MTAPLACPCGGRWSWRAGGGGEPVAPESTTSAAAERVDDGVGGLRSSCHWECHDAAEWECAGLQGVGVRGDRLERERRVR